MFKFFKHRDFLRTALMVAAVALLFAVGVGLAKLTGEEALAPMLSTSAIVIGFALLTHFIRRVLFNRLDIQQIAKRACETPDGASRVFLAVCLFLAVLVYCQTLLMH